MKPSDQAIDPAPHSVLSVGGIIHSTQRNEGERMNKEQIYDEKISPLMTQIIQTCKDHGIAMVASFEIPNDTDPDLQVTTILPNGEGVNPPGHRAAIIFLRDGGNHFAAVFKTTSKKDE